MEEDQLPLHLRAPFPTYGERAVAVSDHPLASQAACDIVARGGNAVDAAVALSCILGVVCPYYAGLGGGGFALVWMPGWERPRWLDFRETAPAAAHPETYLELPEGAAWEGPRSVGVPGQVAGLAELHSQWGSLPWSDLLAPAIDRARRGVRVDANWARIAVMKQERLERWPELMRIFLPQGRAPRVGERIVQAELAATMETLAARGPREFYEGELAGRIAAALPEWLGAADLAGYRVRWREPLRMNWDGGELFTVSSPSAGGLQLLQMLGLMERLGRVSVDEVEFYHRLTKVMRVSFRERTQAVGDPDFGAPDPRRYLNEEWFGHWLPLIRREGRVPLAGPALAYSTGGTASHLVVTRDGGVVLMTESLNHWFGSMVIPKGTGLLLNDIMDDFSTMPHRPDQFNIVPSPYNRVEAGKRPVSSSTPTLWMQDGLPRLLVGSAGGPRITTSVAQIFLQRRWCAQNIQQAVDAPRIHHQWHPDHLEVEPQFPLLLRRGLQKRGRLLLERACRSHAAAAECHWDEGFFTGGCDFRSFGAGRGL